MLKTAMVMQFTDSGIAFGLLTICFGVSESSATHAVRPHQRRSLLVSGIGDILRYIFQVLVIIHATKDWTLRIPSFIHDWKAQVSEISPLTLALL